MANRYANLDGTKSIKSEYSKITQGFDQVETEMDSHTSDADAHDATSESIANRIVLRDANGQAEVGTPTADNHIARKVEIDSLLTLGFYNRSRTVMENLGTTPVQIGTLDRRTLALLKISAPRPGAPSLTGADALVLFAVSHIDLLGNRLVMLSENTNGTISNITNTGFDIAVNTNSTPVNYRVSITSSGGYQVYMRAVEGTISGITTGTLTATTSSLGAWG